MKPALIVIDMQHWFFRIPERKTGLTSLIENTNELIGLFHRHGLPIVHVLTIHKADRSTWPQIMMDEGHAVLIEGTRNAEELPEIKTFDTDIVVQKTRHSSFIRTDLERMLKSQAIDTLVIAGAFTDGCVGLTAIDAHERDFRVFLAKDAILNVKESVANTILDFLSDEFRIEAMSNRDIVKLIDERNP